MTTKCTTVNLYESLTFCKGETTLPGLRPKAYYMPKSLIDTFPVLAKPGDKDATMASIATYKGDFALAADAKWRRIDLLATASNVKAESQGDEPSKTFNNTATIKYAGVGPDATGFCRMANSDDIVYAIQQRDGQWRIVGNEMFETNTKPSQDSGMSVTDASGTTLEITVTDVCPSPYYVGKLVTEDGTIDCATGEVETTVGA